MAWQQYVDQQLVGTGKLNAASILGLDGSTWATSPDFNITPEEGAGLAQLFNNPGDAFTKGVHVASSKYLAVKSDNRSVYAKKGPGGVAVVKTGKAIIVGTYGEGQVPGNAASVVEKLADYLIENGY